MKQFFLHPIVIGGVLPMICFALLNMSLKVVSNELPLGRMLMIIGIGVMLTGAVVHLVSGEAGATSITKYDWGAVGLGVLWGLGMIGLSVALGPLKGNLAQIAPIANANSILTVILAVWILHEKVVLWKVLSGSGLIVLGALLLL